MLSSENTQMLGWGVFVQKWNEFSFLWTLALLVALLLGADPGYSSWDKALTFFTAGRFLKGRQYLFQISFLCIPSNGGQTDMVSKHRWNDFSLIQLFHNTLKQTILNSPNFLNTYSWEIFCGSINTLQSLAPAPPPWSITGHFLFGFLEGKYSPTPACFPSVALLITFIRWLLPIRCVQQTLQLCKITLTFPWNILFILVLSVYTILCVLNCCTFIWN
jgi:hypothetical protein